MGGKRSKDEGGGGGGEDDEVQMRRKRGRSEQLNGQVRSKTSYLNTTRLQLILGREHSFKIAVCFSTCRLPQFFLESRCCRLKGCKVVINTRARVLLINVFGSHFTVNIIMGIL